MVLVATMFILMLAAIALTVTTVSRRTTARYFYHVGLFDLAVSGNEQAFFLLNHEWPALRHDAYVQALIHIASMDGMLAYLHGTVHLTPEGQTVFRDIFANIATGMLHGHVPARLTWSLDANLHTEFGIIRDDYRAITNLAMWGSRFAVDTTVRRYENNVPGTPAVVGASIEWVESGTWIMALDANTSDILMAYEDILLFQPTPGVTIFLDEFALAMVESLRIAD